jgi:hypothetical protein
MITSLLTTKRLARSLSVGGLLQKTQVKYVTVSLTLVDPDGIVPSTRGWGDGPVDCPCVLVDHLIRVEPHSRFCAATVAYPTDTYDSFVVQSNIRSHG